MEIEIRLLKQGEEAEVNQLFNLTYYLERPLSHFEWEFTNGPWGKAIYVVAVDKEKNKIVGTQAAIPVEFISGTGDRIMTAKSEDTLLDPAYRGMGLFNKMYLFLFNACQEKGLKYIWGFTYARKPFLKIGFEIPFETSQGLYTLQPGKAYAYLAKLNPANKLMDKLKIAGLCYLSYFNSLTKGSPGNSISAGLDYKENLLTERSEFVQQAISGGEKKFWTINFSGAYMNWRIKSNPYKNSYLLLNTTKNNQVIADVIGNKREKGFAYLEQMFFNKENSTVDNKATISKLLKLLKAENVFLVRFWGFNQNKINATEVALLKQCGFTFVNKGTAFVWKNLEDVTGPAINPEELVLSRMFTQGNS